MQPTLPEIVEPILDAYFAAVDARLPGFIRGFYLHGSIALGAFDPRVSDVDFVAILSRRATGADFDHLRAIHNAVAQASPQPQLEGIYVQPDDLGKSADDVTPYPYHHDKRVDVGHFELNPVTWWLLKHQAITVRGVPAAALSFEINHDALINYVHDNLNTYWRQWISKPRYISSLMTDAAVEWTVLGVLRLYYTMQTGAITSKIGAGEYALKQLPEKWQPIVLEAIRIREDKPGSLYQSAWLRAVDAFRFLRYVIQKCNV